VTHPLRSPARHDAISRDEFERFATWVDAAAGIHLPERKTSLLLRRLGRRLRELGLTSYGDYLELVRADAAERTRALDLICTNETSFFREPKQFDLLERTVLPGWRREAEEGRRDFRIRVWCAACSSGEEPYSLAMLLLDQLGDDPRWQLDILASDLSSRALARAEDAIFPAAHVARGVAPERIKRHFLRGRNAHEGHLRVAPEVRELVRFQSINLVADSYPVARGLDLVFCRNVLIYFRAERRRLVVERLLALLRSGGLLFLGHAENLAGLGIAARTVIPTVYQRPYADGEPAPADGARR
jgi:chemotaxis protein methyltransferase CheR